MKYTYDAKTERPWPEFFEINKDQFPLLVCITGGHYGSFNYDNFGSDQIYRVQTYTNQRRVVIEARNTHNQDTVTYLSVPVSSKHKFCVIISHKSKDKPKTLEQILKERKFPISVKFSEDEGEIQIGSSRVDHESFATMRITRVYTENFLLGNCFEKGEILPTVTISALSEFISVSIVTGVKGKSPEFFRKHLSDLQKSLIEKGVQYDPTIGNPNITVITSYGTGTGNPLPKLQPPLIPTMTSSDDNRSPEEITYELPVKSTERPQLPPPASQRSKSDLEKLTIEDVSNVLRQLKMDKYIDRFSDDMIDGVILAEFSKEDLKEAFGLTTVEQIRLWKFITIGHIPK